MGKPKSIAYFVWAIASIFYAYQYILRVMPNIMLSEILERYTIDAVLFGQYSGAYYLGYAFAHIPIGLLLDRYGPKNVMAASILLVMLGLAPMAWSEHWILAILGRALIGAGSSGAILGVFKVIRSSFEEKKFTRMLSLSVTIGLIGAIYGGAPLAYLHQTYGYQVIVNSLLILGLVLALVTFLALPGKSNDKQNAPLNDLKAVLGNKKVILLCCFAGLMVGPLEGFADVWGSTYLNTDLNLDAINSGALPSMIFVGMCFGAPLLSLIAEKSGSYTGSIAGAGIVMLSLFVIMLAGLFPTNLLSLGFIIIGVCCSYQVIAIYKASTFVPENMAGLTTAVANMIIMSFGYAFHSSIGLLVNFAGGISEPYSLTYGLAIIPASLAIAIIGLYLVFKTDKIHHPAYKEQKS